MRLARWQPDRGLVEGVVKLGQFPLTTETLALTRRDTLGHTGVAAREAHVELALVERGISVRARPGCEVWLARVDKPQERHAVTERSRTVPRSGWMIFFEDPSRPQRVALLGRSA